MGIFDRMSTSWFKPTAEARRVPRVTFNNVGKLSPTIDERTAEAAAQVLENGAFRRVMDRLKSQAYTDFSNVQSGYAMTELSEIHTRMRALEEIEQQVQAMADELKLHRRPDAA